MNATNTSDVVNATISTTNGTTDKSDYSLMCYNISWCRPMHETLMFVGVVANLASIVIFRFHRDFKGKVFTRLLLPLASVDFYYLGLQLVRGQGLAEMICMGFFKVCSCFSCTTCGTRSTTTCLAWSSDG